MGSCEGLQGDTLWTSSSVQSLEFTWKKCLVWRCFLRHYLSQISLLLTAMCVNQRAFRYFPEIHLFYTRAIYQWLGAFPTEGFKSCVCSAPWWFTAHCTCWICMWTCHLFSIHNQNNAKHVLLYAFQYSQLSSNWLPMVHDKVVAYRRFSIHHQNNAKHALLYAFQYSQLSSNRLPWFMTKSSLIGGYHLWGKKRRISQIFAPRRGRDHLRNLSSGCLQETFWSSICTKWSLMGSDYLRDMVMREMTV